MSVSFDFPLTYSEEWWRVTLSSIGDGVIVTDASGKVTFMNPVAQTLTGWAGEDARSKPLEEIFPIINELNRTQVENPVSKVLETGLVQELANHTLLLARNGVEFHIDDSAAPIKDEQGNIFGVVLVFRDVSERKAAEAARLRLSAIVDSSDDAIISKTLESKITSWNKAAERIFGYTAAEAIGQSITMLIPPERQNEEVMILDKLKRGERIDHYETVRVAKDGRHLDISVTISPIKDSEGNIIGASKIARDITEQKRIEKEIKSRERELSDFVENATIGLHWVGPDGIIIWANQAEMEMLGYSREEYIGHNIAEFHVDQPVIDDILQRLSRDEKLHGYEARLRCKDGSIKYVLINSNVYREDNRFIHTRCFTRDITEQKRAEEIQAYLAAIVESSDDAIVGKTLESIITSWNQGAERIFGYTAEEAIGRSIHLIIPPERHHEEEMILDKLRRGERIEHFETVRRRKDGRLIDISVTISPIKDRSGRIVGASKIARDITEIKKGEAERRQLLEREKAARAKAEEASRLKDEFLATVSHELRTPLNAILGWARLLSAGKLDADGAARAVETIMRNVEAQNRLIEDILDVSRIITGKLRLNVSSVELMPLIEAVLESMRPAAEAKGVKLLSRLDASAGVVSGDSERLQQIVWNLISNAIKFTPKGGQVMVRFERVDSHLEIVVSDTGIGISAEFLPYVFDRFRQADSSITRTHGGLGLGLAVVRHLVELHGGMVRVESAGEGQGATFTVSLPLMPTYRASSAVENRIQQEPSFIAVTSLKGVIALIVDDEPDTRELLVATLEQYGAQVKSAGSVTQALSLLETEQPDIIVSDIGMPETDGYELIKTIRQRGIQIPAIALTAYARAEDRIRALTSGYQFHLAKPVDPDELAIVVANVVMRDRKN